MAKWDRQWRLDDFKRAKYGRSLGEAEQLLAAFGFVERAARKEASIWKRGGVSLTLPRPKSDTLRVACVTLVIRKIEQAEREGIPEEEAI